MDWGVRLQGSGLIYAWLPALILRNQASRWREIAEVLEIRRFSYKFQEFSCPS